MNLKLYLISSISPGLSISPRYTNRACLCKDSTKIQAREAAGTRAMAQLGASRWPEIPAARNASISRHQARPASCPSETIACRIGQPAPTASPQARTAQPTGGGQASQRQDEMRAESAGRASGRRGDGLAGV